jgi:hypothetical protein
MKAFAIGVSALATVALAATEPKRDAAQTSVDKGVAWLIAAQGNDGGWGQDGAGTSRVRPGISIEAAGNDVANTAVALLALSHAGHSIDSPTFRRGLEFILGHLEKSPVDGLAITSIQGTQIQRKLGPHIDIFFTSMLLGEIDGNIKDPRLAARVRQGLDKCVSKIQTNQLKDGSWNISGGWAPILGTSVASRSLDLAAAKGFRVDREALRKVDNYTVKAAKAPPSAEATPVPLYMGAQQLEQLTRTAESRRENAAKIKEISFNMTDARYVRGFGSMGGEEFFSYLNVSDSLRRVGGNEWKTWNTNIKQQLVGLQNDDGTWVGHHCITGRVAVTSAAVLTLVADRELR